MKCLKLFGLRAIPVLCLLLFGISFYVGCGGNSDNASILPNITSNEKPEMVGISFSGEAEEDKYYAELEKTLNEKLSSPSASPSKCATTGLISVILNVTTDEIKTTTTYDLSKIVVTANVAGEQPKIVTPVWTIYSASGTLSGTIYTSIAKSETAVFSATYTENGISKLALFRLKVNGLISISLNKTTSEIQIPGTFDLGSELIVTAKYYNGKTQEINVASGLVWTTNGTGTLNSTVYTAPTKVETDTFTASYTDAGITQKTTFRLTVTGLSTLTLSKLTDEIYLPSTYDLASKITVTAKLSNGQISSINPIWTLYSGSGVLEGSTYTPAAKTETAIFIASYAEPNTTLTKTAQFRLAVIGLYSLTLSQTTDEIHIPETFDLSTITATAKLSNMQTKLVTPVWAVTTGTGTLNGPIYTPPLKPETAVLTASYAEPGVSITKTVQFRLTVTGLYSITLSQITDEIQLPAVYDLGSELTVKASYSDKTTQEVTHLSNLTWILTSGSGTLTGTVYTPSPKVETAVFTASYTDGGIVKTARLSLKVIGLSSLSLNKTTDEVQSCSTYNLADNLIITDKLSDGTTKNVTMDPSTKWILVSGRGSLKEMIYTTPAMAETAVIAASYTEAGITKVINFRLRVNALVSLSLSKFTDEVQISTTFDLAANLKVYAKFYNGQTKEVTITQNTVWTLSFGSGTLNGAIYTAPPRIENVVIIATYTEAGVAQSAQFRLKVSATAPGTKILLIGLTINKTTDAVQIGGTYDLSSLMPIAKYSDKTTKEVNLSWIVTSGGGTVVGNVFTAPANAETVRLMGSCTAEDGSVKSVYFTLKVDGNYGGKMIITSQGANIELKNDIMFEIPPNSVNLTTEIEVKYNSLDLLEPINGQEIITINSSRPINKTNVKLLLGQGMTEKDFNLICISNNSDNIIFPKAVISNNYCTFSIDNGSTSAPQLRSPGDLTPDLEPTENIYIVYDKSKKKYNDLLKSMFDNNRFRFSKSIKWPYYRTLDRTACWDNALLSFLKGYITCSIKNSSQCDTIYKIQKIVNGARIGGLPELNDKSIEGQINWLKTNLKPAIEKKGIRQLIKEYYGREVKIYLCPDSSALCELAAVSIYQNRPLMVWVPTHANIICGIDTCGKFPANISELFNMTFYSTSYVINDINLTSCNKIVKEEDFGTLWDKAPFFICWQMDTPAPSNRSLQTISLSTIAGIKFIDEGSNEITRTEYDYKSINGIKWVPQEYDFLKLKNIVLQDLTIYNSDNNDIDVRVKLSILGNNAILASTECSQENSSSTKFIVPKAGNLPCYLTFSKNKKLVEDFNEKLIKDNITGEQEYTLLVELKNAGNEITLDRFDVKFNYAPPKLRIKAQNTNETGTLGVGNTRQYICMFENTNISENVEWFFKKDGGSEIQFSGPFTPTEYGTYTIITRVKDDCAIPEARGKEVSITVLVVSLAIEFLPKKAGIGESIHVIVTYNGVSVDITKVMWKFIDSIKEIWQEYFPFLRSPSLRSPRLYSPADPNNFTAPLEAGTYTFNGSYNGANGSCSIEIMPLEMTCEVSLLMKQDDTVTFKVKITGITETKEVAITSDNGDVTSVSQVLNPNDYSMLFTYNLKLKDSVKSTAKSVLVKADIVNFVVTRTTQGTITVVRDITISAIAGSLLPGESRSLSATSNGKNIPVGWYVDPDCGTIADNGDGTATYTAPLTPGTYTIRAVYEGIEAFISIKVNPREFKIVPATQTVVAGSIFKFQAYGDTTEITALWSLNNGETYETGVHAAPGNAGTYTVKAVFQGLEAYATLIVTETKLNIVPGSLDGLPTNVRRFKALLGGIDVTDKISWGPFGNNILDIKTTEVNVNGTVQIYLDVYMNDGIPQDQFNLDIRLDQSGTIINGEIPLNSLVISPNNQTLNSGQTFKFKAMAGTNEVEASSWIVVETSAALASGNFSASQAGTYTIKATYQDFVAYAKVTVKLSDLKISPAKWTMKVDETYKFTAMADSVAVDVGVQWTVNNSTFEGGIFTPVSYGKYIIKAVYQGLEASSEVTVNPLEFKITPGAKTMKTGETFNKFIAQADGETAEVTWSADAGTIENGIYTAPTISGTYTIRAMFQNLEASAIVAVNPPTLKIMPENVMLNLNAQQQFYALLDGATKEVQWSASSGSITSAGGLYTAPGQWGKYKITAVYNGINASTEVVVNDERVQLDFRPYSSSSTTPLTQTNMDAYYLPGQTKTYSGYSAGITVSVYGAMASTVELSVVEGNGGRFVSNGVTNRYYGTEPWFVKYNFIYYPPTPTQPFYDTNETIHIQAKCKENTKALGSAEILVIRPVQATVETTFDYGRMRASYQIVKYPGNGGTIYQHGFDNSWYNNTGNKFSEGTIYCGAESGTLRLYYADGKMMRKQVYREDFKEYDSSVWRYLLESRYIAGTGWTDVKYTEKGVEKYSRTLINQGASSFFISQEWYNSSYNFGLYSFTYGFQGQYSASQGWISVPGSRIVTTYDGWNAQ